MENPILEGLKEVARWTIFFIISWAITQTLAQATKIPEFYQVNIWVFTYFIPIRGIIIFILAGIGRWIDKYLFVKDKKIINITNSKRNPQGFLPF